MNSPTYRFIPAMFHAVRLRRKTQTRRVMTPVPREGWFAPTGECYSYEPTLVDRHGEMYPGPAVYGIATEDEGWVAPFGPPGTVKPVVTTWAVHRHYNLWKPAEMLPERLLEMNGIWFDDGVTPKPDWAGKSRPSMFFPSHLYHLAAQARCVEVKVERVQDISEADAIAEGATPSIVGSPDLEAMRYRLGFRTLWDSINERRGYGWQVNPLVFATTFELVQ